MLSEQADGEDQYMSDGHSEMATKLIYTDAFGLSEPDCDWK